MEKDATIYHETLTNTVCVQTAGSSVHLVTLNRAFPVEADHMRQAFAAAAAAPHGGHVMVKEWTVIFSHVEKNTNKVCTQVSYFFQQTQKFSQTSPLLLHLKQLSDAPIIFLIHTDVSNHTVFVVFFQVTAEKKKNKT